MQQYLPSVGPTPESLSRSRRNAVDISALTSNTRTSPIPSRFGRRNAIDYTSSLVKSDWWHAGQPHAFVPRHNYGANPAVPFSSAEHVQAGVAMSELENHQDLNHSSALITSFLPRDWMPKRPFVRLVINWPGYNHLQIVKKLFLFSHNGNPRTLMEVAHDIADFYRSFIHEFHTAFNSAEHGAVRLGPNYVTFGHLRLLGMQLCNPSSGDWIADVSYVQFRAA
ncbi:MAG: hypothetical protein NXY57DRAFT_995108 [Lentinula lateritia]|uniref:Uncharacterized protein n=1 Tax=Lentinula lateritia TaxID=40482 RepID=A0ABQ8VUA9_9AGAR|nr:MAG: hypothetical protein NXY57DRAFT_995108 [Lentinula lateritia]KAJ4499969.1 hypothetical protein C8R41DRAFT_812744 [Lentinula lateritia]